MWKQAVSRTALIDLRRGSQRAVQRTIARTKITVTQTIGSGKKGAPPTEQPAPPPEPPKAINLSEFANPTKKSLRLPDRNKEEALMRIQSDIRTHYSHGNYKDALTASDELMERTKEHFGKEHPATAAAYNNIGLMHKMMGDWRKSRTNYYESLRIYGRVVGKDHASYAAALHNVGALHKMQIHMDESLTAIQRLQLMEEALEYLQDAWRIRKVELGEDHPQTISSRSNYGSTLAAQVLQTKAKSKKSSKMTKLTKQKWLAAEEHLRQALSQATKDADKITTLAAATAAQNLAVFLKTKGTDMDLEGVSKVLDEDCLAEALQLYQGALKVRTEKLSEGHPDIAASKFSIAELMAARGDEVGANALREEIMKEHDVRESDEVPEGDSDETAKAPANEGGPTSTSTAK